MSGSRASLNVQLPPPPSFTRVYSAESATSHACSTEEIAAVRGLPDLSERIVKVGLLEEYEKYKAGYRNWRQGGLRGASGDIETLGTDRRPREIQIPHHEMQFASPKKFAFLFTVSYWIAVLSVIGSIILTFTNLAPLFDLHTATSRHLFRQLLNWIAFGGDLVYTLLSYLSYFELINVENPKNSQLQEESVRFLVCDWGRLRAQVGFETQIGVLAYLFGMLFWDLGAVAELFEGIVEVPFVAQVALVQIPSLIGSFGFAIGGGAETYLHWDKSYQHVEFWASVLNFIGGFLFVVASTVGFFANRWVSLHDVPYFCRSLGMSLYFVTSVMMLVMWKGNDFGLILLGSINDAMRSGQVLRVAPNTEGGLLVRVSAVMIDPTGPTSPSDQQDQEKQERKKERRKKFGTRGVVFLVVYCWLFSVSFMNSASSLLYQQGFGRHLTDFLDGLVWLLAITIVLVIHSAVAHVPYEQPYRFAYITMRFTLAMATISQTARFFQWLPDVVHPYGHQRC